jgi:hypothetical protein
LQLSLPQLIPHHRSRCSDSGHGGNANSPSFLAKWIQYD